MPAGRVLVRTDPLSAAAMTVERLRQTPLHLGPVFREWVDGCAAGSSS